ncbi:MAG: hypothetical protein ACRD1G_19160 [Acidimicrobiales bacterium]
MNADGLCSPHYFRMRKYGRLDLLPKPTVEERFWQHVDRHGPLPSAHAEIGCCWIADLALAGPPGHGYPILKIARRSVKAHRYALSLAIDGDIPAGLSANHTCDNHRCVRNDSIGTYEFEGHVYQRWGHLWLGDAWANNRDKTLKGHAPIADRNGHATKPERTPRGETAGRALLTEAQVLEIRARHAAGETQRSLAAAFGVNPHTVNLIVLRRNWRHI